MNVVAELTISALRESGGCALPNFEEIFNAAFETYEAPFGQAWYGELFREKARDPRWLATSLVLNAEKEGEGARRLWEMAACTADVDAADQVRRHAIDEARHAKIYIGMLDTAFPGCADAELRQHLDGIPPGYSLQDAPERGDVLMDFSYTLDELIQMNIGEVRTRINQLMLEPMILAHCHPSARPKISRMLNSIINDETKHIFYTAALIEKAAQTGHRKLVRDIMFGRLSQFCELTLDEVGAGTFEGS
jgi:hypothetical protein